jgi:DNA gyrase subunit A
VLKLKDGVTLQRVVLCHDNQELVVGSSTGRLLRLAVNEANLPVMGRNAQGPVLLRLLPGERTAGVASVNRDGAVLLGSRNGQLKRLAVNALRLCLRGDLGQIGIRFNDREDYLLVIHEDKASLLGLILTNGQNLRYETTNIPIETDPGSAGSLAFSQNGQLTALVPLEN